MTVEQQDTAPAFDVQAVVAETLDRLSMGPDAAYVTFHQLYRAAEVAALIAFEQAQTGKATEEITEEASE